ncbi:Sybindin-like protein [Carpediemonas membranifera]|uniref:Trafficking protein particle complex subunit n=1 Tax=Carpediemonas membranifera TaxID=201153 RepID=A0A8J6E2E6_9EUKA|nr:Sybindin-like protein [Carpediemonas membranifera]|eukprot:KAG9394598.1 Sybindin-like protein [Carpediemonas membranifera]
MVIHSLFILSQSGNLIYNQVFQERSPEASKISANDQILLASVFHGFHTMGRAIDGSKSGIEKVYFGECVLECRGTPTGLKLFVIADRSSADALTKFLSAIYELLADIVLKNPFQSLQQPIRSELFTQSVSKTALAVK